MKNFRWWRFRCSGRISQWTGRDDNLLFVRELCSNIPARGKMGNNMVKNRPYQPYIKNSSLQHLDPIRITLVWHVANISAASSTVENSTNACCFCVKNKICRMLPNGADTARMSSSVHSSGRLRICRTFEGRQVVIS